VGIALPETECKISEEGEILSRSPSVTPGYYKMPEETAELLAGGWLHSGDAGYIDENGHLVVIDRLSDVMHNSNGEMFSPMFLENKLKFSPYIKEAVIFGDQREYIATLINIDPIVVGKWAEDRGISFTTFMDLSRRPRHFVYHLHGFIPEKRGGRAGTSAGGGFQSKCRKTTF
jgi:long-chain acyl-CoA synthetase